MKGKKAHRRGQIPKAHSGRSGDYHPQQLQGLTIDRLASLAMRVLSGSSPSPIYTGAFPQTLLQRVDHDGTD
jgi:hypothetical protein